MTTEDLWRRAATTRERACDCARLLAALKAGDRVICIGGGRGDSVVTARADHFTLAGESA